MRVWPGRPYPLGATWDGGGVNFSIFSEHATLVELCLFDSQESDKESHRIRMPDQTDMAWHVYLPDVQPGQLYGYRFYGPYDPQSGLRFNPNKVLLDPYAKAIGRDLRWCDAMFGYRIGDPGEDLSFDDRDNAASAPLASVIDTAFTWGSDAPPGTPFHRTIIYELHVKGFSKLNEAIPEPLRGTYAGLATEASLDHLKRLGITAVELMPVHHRVDDRHLVDRGLSNYWGYNTLAFLAPDTRYAADGVGAASVQEFKRMVHAMHSAGIEVILDVVYNHTGEGSHLGPTLSLRGIDNPSYYRLVHDQRRYYMDYTGCGNTLNMQHPRVLQLIMDSLRYWVEEMHVDGFRFDLASALARELHEVDKLGAFFDTIHQDPVISQVKLLAEPWDLGEGGYQVGNFPVGWTEWNGKYRDAIRRFWRGDGGAVSEFATRLSGSSDLYEQSNRRPYASVNFVTAHDGFTLQDLVSYNEKHNETNGEGGADGESHNLSWNCGVEGPADDPEVLALRERQKRNFIATLMLSQGVPMIRAGDELSHTQRGNNNAYCQDNEISWLNWRLDEPKRDFLEFVCRAIRLQHDHPVLHRPKFFQGRPIRGTEIKDIQWLEPSGSEMNDEAWGAPFVRCLGVRLAGDLIGDVDEQGQRMVGETLLLLLSAAPETIRFALPEIQRDERWEVILDAASAQYVKKTFSRGRKYPLEGRSAVVLRLRRPEWQGAPLEAKPKAAVPPEATPAAPSLPEAPVTGPASAEPAKRTRRPEKTADEPPPAERKPGPKRRPRKPRGK